MSVINTQPLIGSSGNQVTGYNLERSLRFRSSASAYLNRTPASAGSRTTWTYSIWVKLGLLSNASGAINLTAGLDGNNRAELRIPNNSGYIDFLFDIAPQL